MTKTRASAVPQSQRATKPLDAGVKIVVKMDGDGQMDPTDMERIIRPIVEEADYTKGNRFFRLDDVRQMPAVRIFGNGCLTFMAKFSTGYWNMFDPTNGYTATFQASFVNCRSSVCIDGTSSSRISCFA